MFDLLAKMLVKDHKNTSDSLVRQRYGIVSGILGIICNLVLFALKLAVGILINSVAVISDAFNNLSDMGSTVVSIAGIKLSNQKPDKDHPFGHGRYEYISALVVSFIIMLVGFELLRSSFDKIISPQPAQDVNWLLIILLALSLPIKLFMFGYNKHFGKAISSAPLLATATDSRNDCIATSAVIISAIVDGLHLLPFVIDGYVGAIVSLLIMYAGFTVAKDTIDLLLGSAPDPETVKAIRDVLLETPEIMDIHDLIVHDYGPGRLFASVHAEISDDADIVAAHEAIDAAEKEIYSRLNCEMSIHMDPVSVNNPILDNARATILATLKECDCPWNIHDLRMTDGAENINIIFDMMVPFNVSAERTKEICSSIRNALTSVDSRYSVVIQIDTDFSNVIK